MQVQVEAANGRTSVIIRYAGGGTEMVFLPGELGEAAATEAALLWLQAPEVRRDFEPLPWGWELETASLQA